MIRQNGRPLIVGEVFVDVVVKEPDKQNMLRLGGIVHAARAFWALNLRFSAAVFLPAYLERSTRRYLRALGCIDFHVMGYVTGAPNIVTILDLKEMADQGYETLLRDEKEIELLPVSLISAGYSQVLIFPGMYSLDTLAAALPPKALLHIDVAYDVVDPSSLSEISQEIQTILISTSSPLFKSSATNGISDLIQAFQECSATTLILKENRGGGRMILTKTGEIEALPAQLGRTANSVGVGDVFSAAYVALWDRGGVEAAWRATYAAAAYSQTTDLDLFKIYVERDLRLNLGEIQHLRGVFLPWEARREFPIYLAAPDFTYANRRAIDRAIAALSYHNFPVRRPVIENGELPAASPLGVLRQTYRADYKLLKQCALIFAVPTGRDPGTLVEVGIAYEAGIPVVVYDASCENQNAMVMAGAQCYSHDLDECLNAVFQILSVAFNNA